MFFLKEKRGYQFFGFEQFVVFSEWLKSEVNFVEAFL